MPTDSCRIYCKTSKRLWLLIGAFWLLTCSILCIFFNEQIAQSSHESRKFIISLGAFGILFFGFGLFIIVRMYFRPVVIIDEEGIIDHASGVSVGRIPWGNIQEVKPLDFVMYTYVGIVPVNNQEVLNGVNILKRKLLGIRLLQKVPLVIIPAGLLGIDASQLIAEINSRRR